LFKLLFEGVQCRQGFKFIGHIVPKRGNYFEVGLDIGSPVLNFVIFLYDFRSL